MVESLVDTIADGTVGEEGGKAALAGIDQLGLAADIQEGLLLTGEAGIGKVFRRGGAADGNIRVLSVLFTELLIGWRMASFKSAGSSAE